MISGHLRRFDGVQLMASREVGVLVNAFDIGAESSLEDIACFDEDNAADLARFAVGEPEQGHGSPWRVRYGGAIRGFPKSDGPVGSPEAGRSVRDALTPRPPRTSTPDGIATSRTSSRLLISIT